MLQLHNSCRVAGALMTPAAVLPTPLQEDDATGPIVTAAEQQHQEQAGGQAGPAGAASQSQAAGDVAKQQQELLGRKFGVGAAAAA
jgi:hypothetical protein